MRRDKVIFLVVPCLFSLSCIAAEKINTSLQWGRVNMQGAIIDTACAIAVESREQTIEMDAIPLADIVRDGQGGKKKLSIELVNCTIERPGKDHWRQFQVTFDGDVEGSLFGVRGAASGIALQIIDVKGNIAKPGEPLPPVDIKPGDMQLNYTLKLVANSHALKAGDYFSAIRFKLDYF